MEILQCQTYIKKFKKRCTYQYPKVEVKKAYCHYYTSKIRRVINDFITLLEGGINIFQNPTFYTYEDENNKWYSNILMAQPNLKYYIFSILFEYFFSKCYLIKMHDN